MILLSNLNTMKTRIISIAQILLGAFFIAMTESDIQLGFGLVLLTQGIYNYE